jgi:hypothetical protein
VTITELLIKFGIDASGAHSGAADFNRAQKSIEDQTTKTTGKMSRGFDEAGGHVSKLGGLMQGVTMGMGMGLFNVAEEGLGKLTGVITDSSAAYRDAQTSQAQFSTALVDQHIPAVDATNAAMETYLKKNEALGFSADEQRSSLALLVGQTHDLGKAQTELSDAEDLARLKGIPLAAASSAIEKAMLGSTGGLKRYGIEVAKGSTATQILADVEKVAGNQADAYAAGQAGRLAAAHEKVHEVMVKIGAITDQVTTAVMPALADAFSNIIDAAQPFLDQLGRDMPGYIAKAREALDWLRVNILPKLQAAFEVFVKNVLPALDKAFEWVAANILPKLAVAFDWIVKNVLPALGQAFGYIVSDVMPALTTAFNWIVANVIPPLVAAFQTVAGFVTGTLIPVITNVVKTVWPPLQGLFQTFTKDVLPKLVAAFKGLTDFWNDSLAPILKTIVDTVWPPLAKVIDFMTNVALKELEIEWGLFASAVQTAVDLAMKILGPFVDLVNTAVTGLDRLTGNNGKGAFVGGGTLGNIIGGHESGTGGKVGGYAGGTSSAPGGPAWVGERGPELLNLPSGTSVTPAGQVGQGGGNVTHNHFTFNGPVKADTPESIAWQVRRSLAFGRAH